MLIWLGALAAALPLAGLAYQRVGQRRDARRLPAPGRVVGGFHIYETGSGSPTIILESGIAASSLNWRRVQESLSEVARVASYDRAGFGWSAPPRSPRTIPNLVEELHELLKESELPGPYVFVGHSFGGLLLRHYTAKYKEDVKALVLVDPLEPFEWNPMTDMQSYRLGKGVMLSRRGATLARFGIVRLALDLLSSGKLALPKLLSKVSSGRGSMVTDHMVAEVRKMPPEVWPAIRSHWCVPKSFLTMAEYLERLPEACALATDDAALCDVPLMVISAGRSAPAVIEAHRRTAANSARGEHVVAENSGHWVQLDQPELVAEAARRIAGLQ